jgi:hypothetical protein
MLTHFASEVAELKLTHLLRSEQGEREDSPPATGTPVLGSRPRRECLVLDGERAEARYFDTFTTPAATGPTTRTNWHYECANAACSG